MNETSPIISSRPFGLVSGRATLVLSIAGVAFAPMAGALLRWGRPPAAFGVFPPTVAGAAKPEWSIAYFAVAMIAILLITAFLVAPTLFGFRRPPAVVASPSRAASLPWWFFAGGATNLASWALMWFGSLPFAAFAFLPLWWGFIVAIDGVTFARKGASQLSRSPLRLLAIGLVSIPGWWLFELLNFYGLELWIYPNDQILSHTGRTIWFLACFSTVLPTVFVWQELLSTFRSVRARYAHGPAFTMERKHHLACIGLGLVMMFLYGLVPFETYPLFWVGPGLVFGSTLELCGFWTPLRAIARGDWSPLVLAALAALANGFFWELWNYGSEFFHAGHPTNPSYWVYQVPYLDRFHFFSEMPLLGYFGYLPYGIVAWLTWLVGANILGLSPEPREASAEDPTPLW